MKLTVLGKYGPFPKEGGATSSYLLNVNGKNILLDCGAGSVSRLLKYIKPEDIDVIMLSHFHLDHSSDIGVLSYYYQVLTANGFNKKPLLFCPEGGGPLFEMVENSPYFEVSVVRGGEISMLDDIDFEFFPMRHPVESVGVKISCGGKTFAYTGDTNVCDSVEDLCDGADLVLADGGFLKKDWAELKPHLSVEHIVEYTNKYGNKSIISHINPKYTEEELQNVIAKAEGKCLIAQEGKTYEI